MRLMEIDRTGTCFAMTRPVLPLPDGCSSLGREKNIRPTGVRDPGDGVYSLEYWLFGEKVEERGGGGEWRHRDDE